jgi:hypothetical protein
MSVSREETRGMPAEAGIPVEGRVYSEGYWIGDPPAGAPFCVAGSAAVP